MKKDKSLHTASVYDKIVEEYTQNFQEPTDFIDEFLELIPHKSRILDAGCGIGTDAAYIKSAGYEVRGIDLSEEMVKMARKLNPHIEFEVEDLREPKYPDMYFGGIVGSFSLIHVPKKDISKTLDRYYQILKPEGIIFLALQCGKTEELYVDEPYKAGEKTFLNIFSETEIKDELEKACFSVMKIKKRYPVEGKEFNYQKLFVWAKKE